MATLIDLVLRTEEILYGPGLYERPDEDVTASALANGTATSVDVATSGMWQRGDYMEFAPADGSVDEVVLIGSISSATCTIRRGQRGSTAAAQSSGDVIRRNPAFPRVAISQAIEHVIEGELWPHVWSWHKGSFTYTSGDHLYDLGQYIEDVVSVYQADINTDGTFAPIDPGQYEVVRQVNTAVSTNSNLLRVNNVWDENTTVYYTAKRRPRFADIANLDALVADLVPYGAASRLLLARAPQIDGSQKRSGRAGGRDMGTYGQVYKQMFDQMVDQYRRQLLLEVAPEPRFKHRFGKRW